MILNLSQDFHVEKYCYQQILEQFNADNKINRTDYISKIFKLLFSTKIHLQDARTSCKNYIITIKSWNWGRIVEKLRLIIGISRRTISLRHICIKNRLPITTSWRLKKKLDPRIPFFFTPHLVRFLAPRGSATQLVQPNGAPWIISNPIPLYRFEQRPWFFREKKTILLGNFVVAGQLESGTRKRARHWSIQEPTIESRFHVFLFDFRIDRFNGRTWLRIAPSFARVVPLSRRISLSSYFFFLSFNELGSHVSAKSMLPCGKYPDISLW